MGVVKDAQVFMGHKIPIFLQNNVKPYADRNFTLTEMLHGPDLHYSDEDLILIEIALCETHSPVKGFAIGR